MVLNNTQSRERRFRHIYITNLLELKYKLITWGDVPDICTDYASCIRFWQLILKENESLRGHDYLDGKILQQKQILDLGYSMGFNEDLKKLEQLNIKNEI